MNRGRSNSMFEDVKSNLVNEKLNKLHAYSSCCETIHENPVPNAFQRELQNLRNHIQSEFHKLRNLINAKEEKMLRSIREAEENYYSCSKHKTFEEINQLKVYINNIAKDNMLRSQLISGIHENMERITAENAEICISFNWPSSIRSSIEQLDETLKITKHAGSKDDSPLDNMDVSATNNTTYRISPNFSFGTTGDNPRSLLAPRGLAVEFKTGNIFCTDWEGNAIFVFSRFGDFLRKITDVKNPYGICCGTDRIFITEASNSLIKFGKVGNHACIKSLSFDGEIINRTGKWGSSNGNLKSPSGLTFNEVHSQLYVCDTENNRVQIFQNNLTFNLILTHQKLKDPYDVKVHNDEIYILDKGNPCLHKFSIDGTLINSMISRGSQFDVGLSHFFVVDKSGCVLLTDHENHQLKVFTPNGQLARVIGKEGNRACDFYMPLGIAYSKESEIVVVSLKQTGAIQMFNINFSIF